MLAGKLNPSLVRTIEVEDALVDTGAISLSMPNRLIKQLGLRPVNTKRVRTTNGVVRSNLYSSVRLWVQGEWCTTDVYELPDDVPVLIGQIPLEAMDWVVDSPRQTAHC